MAEEYGGNIIVEAVLNSENFDAGAAKLENRMKRAAQNVDKATKNVEKLEQELKSLNAVAESEKASRSTGTVTQATGDAIAQTTERLSAAQTQLERYAIDQREAADALREYNAQAGSASSALQTVSDRMEKFQKRVVGLAKRVFIFTMITKALRTMRSAIMGTISADTQMSNSLAQIKGNLITAFAPIYNFVLPAIRTLLNWIAKLTATIATFVNSLFGKTAAQASESAKALYDQANATEAAGSAAEKAEKQLASFDTINKLSSDTSSGGAGGGASGTSPQFNLENQVDTEKIEKVASVVKQLWPYVAAIGAGFAAWKIGTALFGSMNMVKALAVAIAGAVLMVISFIDMMKNGINGENLTAFLTGATLLVIGLGVAFGTVGAAIGLLIAGIMLLVAGVKDLFENGFNNKNLAVLTAGLLAIGAAISLITGSWIPILIAAILTAVLWIIGKWDDLKGFFKDTVDAIGSFFSDLWKDVKNGANSAWEGIKNAFKSIPQWFKDKFSEAWTKVKNVFSTGGQIWSGIKEGIENTFRTVVNKIIDGMNKVVAWPFNKINSMLNTIKDLSFLGISPFKNLWSYNPLPVPQIPALAQGAVIPGGRAFLSVLGDQPAGQTNIETPLDTMIEAFRRAGGGKQTIIIKIGDTEFKRFVYDAYNSEASRLGKSYA